MKDSLNKFGYHRKNTDKAIIWFFGIFILFVNRSDVLHICIYWFNDAAEMVSFLTQASSDPKKHYELIDLFTTAKQRSRKNAGYPITDTQSLHMVSVDRNGNFTTKRILDVEDDLVSMKFLTEVINDDVLFEDLLSDEESSEYKSELPEDVVLLPMVYEVIIPESFLGLLSPSEHRTIFCCKGCREKHSKGVRPGPISPPNFTKWTLSNSSWFWLQGSNMSFGMATNATHVFVHVCEVFAIIFKWILI